MLIATHWQDELMSYYSSLLITLAYYVVYALQLCFAFKTYCLKFQLEHIIVIAINYPSVILLV